jgi:hypothetical protein
MRLQKSSRRWSEALCPLEAVGVVVWSRRSEVARSQSPVSTARSQTAIAKFREHAFYEPRTVGVRVRRRRGAVVATDPASATPIATTVLPFRIGMAVDGEVKMSLAT